MRNVTINHRTRLTLATTGIAAAILALVFLGIIGLSQRLELRADHHLLDSALKQVSDEITAKEQLAEVKEAYTAFPNISFVIYSKNGTEQTKIGRLPLDNNSTFDLRQDGASSFASEGIETKDYKIEAGIDWTLTKARLHRFTLILAFLWFFMVGVVGVVSWYAAAATFKPLFKLTEQAAEFSGADLSRRLESSDTAEFGEFATQLNLMLDHVEETAKREEQFASDAAHELRTPLAILRGRIESTLMKTRSPNEYQKAMESMLPEVDRLTGILEMLLRSATANHHPAPVTELSDVLQQTAARWLDRFEASGVHLEVTAQEAYAQIWPEELQCIVDNFLNNALRVSPSGSVCRVVLETVDGRAVVRVADEGTGVPDELIGKVFERFTRGESSRNRASGGFGIGLAVCKNIVATRGGQISVQNRKPGAEFKVELQTVAPK
ncbi:MAG TPA: ATP-binding protein [Fimbriimonadaceae bacterium]